MIRSGEVGIVYATLEITTSATVVEALVDVLFEHFRDATGSVDEAVNQNTAVAVSERATNRVRAWQVLRRRNLPLDTDTRVKLARFLPHSEFVLFLLTAPEYGGAHPGDGAAFWRSLETAPFQDTASKTFLTTDRLIDTLVLWFSSTTLTLPPDAYNTTEFIGLLHAAFPTLPASALHTQIFALDGPYHAVSTLVLEALQSFPTGCMSPDCMHPAPAKARLALLSHLISEHPDPLGELIRTTHTLICAPR
jgi:hypothetical protein